MYTACTGQVHVQLLLSSFPAVEQIYGCCRQTSQTRRQLPCVRRERLVLLYGQRVTTQGSLCFVTLFHFVSVWFLYALLMSLLFCVLFVFSPGFVRFEFPTTCSLLLSSVQPIRYIIVIFHLYIYPFTYLSLVYVITDYCLFFSLLFRQFDVGIRNKNKPSVQLRPHH